MWSEKTLSVGTEIVSLSIRRENKRWGEDRTVEGPGSSGGGGHDGERRNLRKSERRAFECFNSSVAGRELNARERRRERGGCGWRMGVARMQLKLMDGTAASVGFGGASPKGEVCHRADQWQKSRS